MTLDLSRLVSLYFCTRIGAYWSHVIAWMSFRRKCRVEAVVAIL